MFELFDVTQDWERHFHTWTMEWDKDYILIQVDRQTLLKLDLSVADPVRTTWPNPFTNDKKCLVSGLTFFFKKIHGECF